MAALPALAIVAFLTPCLLVGQESPFHPVHGTLPADGVAVEALAVGDLDGDGDPDLLVGRSGSDRVWLNDGQGVFVDASATHWPGDSSSATDVGLADLDGDGDLDAVVAELGGPVHAYANDGSGRFRDVTARWMPPMPSFPSAVALGDLDGDGDADLLVGHGARIQDQLYLNDGTGRMVGVTASHLPGDSAVTFAVGLGDLDGDGDLDAVLGSFFGQTRLYRNDGTGRFTDDTVASLPADSGSTRSLAIGDVDGDGDADLVLGEASLAQNRLYLNGGGGRFTDATATHLPRGLGTTYDLALADLDGDGDRDLLLAEFRDPCQVLRNDGSGVFTRLTGAVPMDPGLVVHVLAVFDSDADGDLDAVLGNASGLSQAWLNDGGGRFVDASLPPFVDALQGYEMFEVLFADFDGDGDRDLFVANGHPFSLQPNLLLRQRDDGRFEDVSVASLPRIPAASQGAAAGDLDGDGDLDVLVGNAANQQNQLLLNGGQGVFVDATATHLPVLLDETYEVTFGDVDGDGDLDAWIANWRAPDGLLLNDGTAHFVDGRARIPAHAGATSAVAFGDVDGDGDLDALAVFAGEQNRLYLNDGSGTFSDATVGRLPVRLDGSEDVALGDLDGDGDLDAWVANQVHADGLLFNDGAGAFRAGTLPSIGVDSTSVVLVDVDQDGDLEVVLAQGTLEIVVLWNDGAGNLSRASSSVQLTSAAPPNRLAVADAEGDGDPDLAAVGYEAVFRPNNLRQLQWRGLPRIGAPLRLDLHGPARGAWYLNVGTTATWQPTRFGVLRLVPAGMLAVFSGPLDGQGQGLLTLQVPVDPRWIGVTLYWQGVLVDANARIACTNLEVTQFAAN